MKPWVKRSIAYLLSIVLAIGTMPAFAFAEETQQGTAVDEQQMEATQEQQTESVQEQTEQSEDEKQEDESVAAEDAETAEEVEEVEEAEEPGAVEQDEEPLGEEPQEEEIQQEDESVESNSDESEESDEFQEEHEISAEELGDEKEESQDMDENEIELEDAIENEEAEEEKDQEEGEEPEEDAQEESEAFFQETEVDDVIVKVDAEPGTFPNGAKLIVEKVNKEDEAKATEAIDEVRSEDVVVAESYTFDIKVLDEEGMEFQTAEGKKANVSFNLKRASDSNLTADVYHITETEVEDGQSEETFIEAKKLETETDAEDASVTAETDGFSLYTVEFTYSNIQYVMEGDTSISLAEILAFVGLSGEVESVIVSNEELFSASYESGEWVINSHEPFSSEEWMKVVIDGVEYIINVTDDSDIVDVNTWQALMDAVKNSGNKGKTIRLTDHLDAKGKDRILIKQNLTVDLNGKVIDRGLTKNDSDGHVFEIQNKATVTITDSKDNPTGTIQGGYASRGGGIHVGTDCTCIVKNITIRKNKAGVDGGGIYVRGTLIMENCLIKDNEAEDTAGGIYCQDTGTIKLDNVEINGNKAENDGGGLKIHLKNSDSYINNSLIRYNTSKTEDGGGFCLDASEKTLTVSNTKIIGNDAEDFGGGIVVEAGKLRMTGGLVKDNRSKDGAGVYNGDGTIDLDGVEITGNTSTEKGGAGVNNKNNATLKNCIISNNEGHDLGGGIYSNDDITIESCTIEGNTSTGDGGGIYFKNINATIKNCIIRNNSTDKSGGAIRIKDGNIKIIDTTMTGNIAKEHGGAVYVNNDADVYFTGNTTITENRANGQGGAILVGIYTDTLGLQDKVIIKDNTSGSLGSNVQLGYIDETYLNDFEGFFDDFSIIHDEHAWQHLTITGRLYEESSIYVTSQENFKNYSYEMTKDYSKYHNGEDPLKYFTTDPGYTVVVRQGKSECSLALTQWPNLQRLIDATEDGGTLTLENNWKAISGDQPLTIAEGKTITIDLAGYTIDRNRLGEKTNSTGYVFDVKGTLIVKDSSAGTIGKIIGGNGEKGGGIYVCSTGSFTMEKGNICDNKAGKGAGIYNEGTVQIIGGNIKSNNASEEGAALYNATNATATLSGGKLSENDAQKTAGGVYIAEGSIFNVEDKAYVYGNAAPLGNNIFISEANGLMNVTGALSDDASLDFTVKVSDPTQERKVTSGLNNIGKEVFGYNGRTYNDPYVQMLKVGADGELYIKASDATCDVLVSSWKQLYDALRNSANEGKTIGLANDIKATSNDDKELEAKVENITLDLRGFTLDRNSKTGSVLNLVDDYRFTVRDSVGSGLITGGNANHGGGIYVTKGTFTMIGGTIGNNKVSKEGAGIYCKEKGNIILARVNISHNIAGEHGGGIALVDKGIAGDSHLGDCIIENNEAERGGGIYIENHELEIDYGTIRGNTAEEGGGIEVYNGTITINQAAIQDNKAIKYGGAGIKNTNSNVLLQDSAIIENRAEASSGKSHSGGGIWTKGGQMTISGCSVMSNYAAIGGGGIKALGPCRLIDSIVSGNTAGQEADGILVDTDKFYIAGKVVVFDNTDNQNISLEVNRKLILEDELDDEAKIGVALKNNRGEFTANYKDYHAADEPSKYFYSDYGYTVSKARNGEGELILVLNDGSNFIDKDSQINDGDKLSGRNWMSGISGDRYLNEINIPCTHDSGMNSVRNVTMSSVGSYLGYSKNAKTQVRYIDEQFNDGIRRIDVRLTRFYEVSDWGGLSVDKKDDGVNLYINHGKDNIGGSYWAEDHNGNLLTLNTILNWAKAFLTEHPTEVLILDLQPEPPGIYVDNADEEARKTYERARTIIEGINGEINPSTGKPFIYWQNGAFQWFDHYPQLKECRGQIIFNGANESVGGIPSFSMGNVTDDSPKGGIHGDTANHVVSTIKRFYRDTDAVRFIPKDVTEHLDVIYRSGALTAPLGFESIPTSTPLEAASTIHDALYINGDVYNQTMPDGTQRGQYVGWIRQDGVTAQHNRMIWMSNFPSDLNYVTVTVEPGTETVSPSAPVQTYKLLKGTEFIIPGDIYGNDVELEKWDATVPSESETDGDSYYTEGETYKVMKDVTFTANWGTQVAPQVETNTPIKVNWIDSSNQDEVRPTKLIIDYEAETESVTEAGSIELPSEEAWEKTVDKNVTKIVSIKDQDGKIIPRSGIEAGSDDNKDYYYTATFNKQSGYLISMYYVVPVEEPDVYIGGKIFWEDGNNAKETRPDKVTVRVFNKDDQEVGSVEVEPNEGEWIWYFNLSLLEGYDSYDGFSVKQDQVEGYEEPIITQEAEGIYSITNKLSGETGDSSGTDEPGETAHNLEKVDAAPATCTEKGNVEYWECNLCGKAFLDEEGTRETDTEKTVGKGGVIIPATGHSWGEPSYVWDENNATVTGRSICGNDHDHILEETVNTTSEVTKEPSRTEEGERTFTAIFKGDNHFEEQTKVVKIPSTGVERTITFSLNGGTYKGIEEDITIVALEGDYITVLDAPEKEGYEFLYWKGSVYYPGDKYKVEEDHTLTAQWKKLREPDPEPTEPQPGNSDVDPEEPNESDEVDPSDDSGKDGKVDPNEEPGEEENSEGSKNESDEGAADTSKDGKDGDKETTNNFSKDAPSNSDDEEKAAASEKPSKDNNQKSSGNSSGNRQTDKSKESHAGVPTGDDGHMWTWFIIMLCSMLIVISMPIIRRRYEKQ